MFTFFSDIKIVMIFPTPAMATDIIVCLFYCCSSGRMAFKRKGTTKHG